MNSFRYVVGVTLPNTDLAERWLDWLRNGHIAEVIAGGATEATIYRVDGTDHSFEIVYAFPTREAFVHYERDHAPRLREEGRRLFPPEQGVVYRRSTAEFIERFPERQ